MAYIYLNKTEEEKKRAALREQGLCPEVIDLVIDFLKKAEQRDREAGMAENERAEERENAEYRT